MIEPQSGSTDPSSSSARRSITTHVVIVAVAFLASRILGLVREIVIASRFGTSETYDAYVAAFRIPDLLFVLVMGGAFGSAFIPVFGGFLTRGDAERGWQLANALLTYTVIALLIASQIVLVLAEPLVANLIAPELSPDSQALAIDLTRLLLLSPLLLGLGAAAKGMLEAQDQFTLPAIAPLLYNVGIIGGALLLSDRFGMYGLAWGVIAGAAAHAGIQFAGLFRRGVRFRPRLSRQTEGLSEVVRLLGPRLAGQAVGQINLIVMINFASRLGEGRIGALSYAQHLVMLPHGLLAMSLSTVMFPLLARQFEQRDLDAMKETLRRSLGPLIFLTLPAAIGLVAFRTSIVQMVFQFGSFTRESTELVAEAVGYLAIGLLARSIVEVLTRTFYATRDTRTPLLISVAAIGVNIGLCWMLAPRMGVGGIALSLSITYTVRMAIMFALLSWRIEGLGSSLTKTVPRIALTSLVFGIFAFAAAPALTNMTDSADGHSLRTYVVFFSAVIGIAVIYPIVARLLRVPELDWLLAMVMRRIRRSSGS